MAVIGGVVPLDLVTPTPMTAIRPTVARVPGSVALGSTSLH